MIIVDRQTKSLVLPADIGAQMSGLKRDFKVNGLNLTAVPHTDWTTIEAQQLTGKPIEAPIACYYDWPGPYTPRIHQIETATHLVMLQRAFCWDDIGTGKTAATIWAMLWARLHHGVKRVLVVSPKSTLRTTWQKELFLLQPTLNVAVLDKTRSHKLEQLRDDYDVYIINPDSLWRVDEAISAMDPDLIIVDEQTYFKTWNTNRTKALRSLTPDKRVWMLSGEPQPEGPMDLFAPGKIVCPEVMPRSKTRWQDMTMIKVGQWKWVPKPGVEDMISQLFAPYAIRHARDDCIDLPDTTYTTIEVEPTTQQLKISAELEKEAAADVDEGVIMAVNEAAHLQKLLQISCGAVRVDLNEGKHIHNIDTTKLDALDDIIQATHGPLIVFAPFTAVLDSLETWLKKQKVSYHRVDGQTSSSKRNDVFNDIQEDNVKVLLANPRAMSHGITLTTSNTIVWFGLPWSNETYSQANGRIIRSGQQRKTYIIHLTCMPVEKMVYCRLRDKQKLQGTLLQLLKQEVVQ